MKTALLLFMLLAAPAFARRHTRVPEYRVFPPSHQSLVDQNDEANRLGLHPIRDKSGMLELLGSGELVPITTGPGLRVICPRDRALVRPWVDDLLLDLAGAYYRRFGKPLQVTSATRPVTVQVRLLRWNRNAAPAHGVLTSVHMRGIAVDLQRRGLTTGQKRWLQWRLLYYYGRGLVMVEEELRHPCFHVVVRRNPLPGYVLDTTTSAGLPNIPEPGF